MKRNLLLLGAAVACVQLSAQRYLTEVFSDATVTSDVTYGANITVITGSPALDTLRVDIYEPTGDSLTERPLVMFAHTGSFLPTPINGQCTGGKTDSAVVEICTQFAKRGYVAAAFTHRLGWNPASPVQEVRTGTLINAAYRGIQDAHTLVRFFRMTAGVGNPYGIDTNAIILGGMGTGGYIAMALPVLDSIEEISVPKFIDPNTSMPYVDTSLSGDIEGTWARPLNVPNHVGFSSDIHFSFNMGGALGDSTWIDGGEVPHVGFHVPSDPFAPYTWGAVIVPTTGDFVVNVTGTYNMLRIYNQNGNQDPVKAYVYNDDYTTRADAINDGWEGLLPFFRPTPESAPWEWWNSTIWGGIPHPSGGTFDDVCKMTNPDMSKTKALAYIDSVMNYANPRIACTLQLANCQAVGTDEAPGGYLTVVPNPASDRIHINSIGSTLETVELFDMSGRQVYSAQASGTDYHIIDRGDLSSGVYVLNVAIDGQRLSQKVVLD